MPCTRFRFLPPAGVAALIAAAPATAHQTAYDRGTAVTLHVAPDDEPVAGRPATVTIVRVRPVKGGHFTFRSCACRLRIADASGATLLDRRVGKRTRFTFPRAAAYRITVSGRYHRGSGARSFKTFFSLRAIAG